MINKYFQKIKNIEFDLSSTCNAYCASCARYVVEDGALKLNPHVNFNKNISLETIEQLFSNPMVADNVKVPMVGSVGDPMANPEIVEILETIFKLRPNADVCIHSNGGLRTLDIWESVAKLGRPSGFDLQIYFSIDGLEDTNHLYRHGVIWEKLMENAAAFNNAGGFSKWKFVEFEWNKHQIEEARQMSKDMGFNSFDLIKDRSRGHERETIYNPAKDNIKKKEYGRISNTEFRITGHKRDSWTTPIKSECLDIEGIYINSDELVVPCCKWATGLNTTSEKQEIYEFLYDGNIPNWNSLKHYSIDKIMTNKFWEKLGDSLQSNKTSCTRCLMGCSDKVNA